MYKYCFIWRKEGILNFLSIEDISCYFYLEFYVTYEHFTFSSLRCIYTHVEVNDAPETMFSPQAVGTTIYSSSNPSVVKLGFEKID
jgi:hypothetical protein